MRPKVKTATRKASKLRGATAGFVSLVDRGANETPFTIIKTAQGDGAMSIKRRNAAKSHKKVASGRKQTTETKTVTEMAKMVFSADVFETEDEVREQIEKMEWEASDIDVTEDDDGNLVARVGGFEDDDYLALAKVETDEDGVDAFVGKRVAKDDEEGDDEEGEDEEDDEASIETKADDEDDEGDEDEEGDEDDEEEEPKPAAKSVKKPTAKKKAAPKTVSKRQAFVAKRKEEADASLVQKFDPWDARFSDGNTLAKTLTDGMEWDGLPPGYYDVMAAFSACVGNIVADDGLGTGKQEALNKAAADVAEIVGGLDAFFDQYVDADEELVAKVAKTSEQKSALKKWAENYGDVIASKGVQKSAKAAGDVDVQSIADAAGSTVGALLAKALDPLSKRLEEVSGTVESIATRRPSKKAAAQDDAGNGSPRQKEAKSEEDTESWARRKTQKGIFG